MNSKRLMAMAVVGVMIASGFSMILCIQNASASTNPNADWITTADRSDQTFRVQITQPESYTTIKNDARFHGPANIMVRAQNGDLLIFDRNGTSHVSAGDYAHVDMLRSTDDGLTWTTTNNIWTIPTRDLRNYASGVSSTGRIFLFSWVCDIDNGTGYGLIDLHGSLQYRYSDNNGSTWSAAQTFVTGIVGGFNGTNIASPYGPMLILQNNRIGFSYYSFDGDDAVNASQACFAYSDNNGGSWTKTNITAVGYIHVGVLAGWYDETGLAYLGDGKLVALTRSDGATRHLMSTSTDNGATWSFRGVVSMGIVGPPTLMTITDGLGGIWVLAQVYNNYCEVRFGYGPDLITDGISAWSPFREMGVVDDVSYGVYGSAVWSPRLSAYIIVTETNVGSSDISQHTVKMQVLMGSLNLPANVHQYVTLVLVMFGLVMVVTTVGFMSKAKDKGISKEDVIELTIFLVVSLILMGVLTVLLGS